MSQVTKPKSASAKAKAKASTPAATPAKRAPSVDRRREHAGLFFGALGLASLLGLVSFTRPTNWVGPVGHFLANCLLGIFGVGSYPIVLIMLATSVLWLLGKRLPVPVAGILCALGIFFSGGVLLTLFLSGSIQQHPPAGALGVALAGRLVSLFSVPGSTILSGAVLFGSLIILADIELKQVLEALGQSGKVIASPVFVGVGLAQEAWREAREAQEIARAEAAAVREERRMQRLEDLDSPEEEEPEASQAEEPAQAYVLPSSPVEEPKKRRGKTKPEAELKAEEPRPEPLISSHAPKLSEDLKPEEAPRNKRTRSKLPDVTGDLSAPIIMGAAAAQIPMSAALPVVEIAAAMLPIRVEDGPRIPKEPKQIAKEAPLEDFQAPEDALNDNEDDEAIGEALLQYTRKLTDGPTIIAPPVRPKPAGLTIVEPKAAKKPTIPDEKRPQEFKDYPLPPLSFLDYKEPKNTNIDRAALTANARKLEQKLLDYHVPGNVVEIHPGPVITMYEFCPGPGIKVSKISSLSDDLAMALQAERVRIIAPIPGKNAVGIEIPNPTRETVYLKEILADNVFQKSESKLCLGIGKDVSGAPKVADLAKMPHLLVAGATGAGKSVAINTFICSILFNATPKEVRFLMVDPKMLELSIYEGIPHLLLPVVTDMKKAALALRWAVDEMERRYQLLADAGVRNIVNYNNKLEQKRADAERMKRSAISDLEDFDSGAPAEGADPLFIKKDEIPEALPYIVVIIDELADLMMVASRDVETSIARLAQMARAAGIHLILATQRPSVDVITGLIKANFPTRISFQVTSRIDSRTILDQQGAENLLGMGDMLIMERGKVQRFHGALVQEEEIHQLVEYLKLQGTPLYDESILAARDEDGELAEEEEEEKDVLYDQALAIVLDSRQASTSMVQRKLKIGYNRAARLIEFMEKQGIVGPADGAKPREVLIQQ
jgi:DNA segregation ATPase FtsK/SpoIIIE, S-DNA-T family